MANARKKSAEAILLSIPECAERAGLGISATRRLANEGHCMIVISDRIKRVDFERFMDHLRTEYTQ